MLTCAHALQISKAKRPSNRGVYGWQPTDEQISHLASGITYNEEIIMKITYNDKHCILQITDASLDDRGYLELEFNDDLELVWANDNSFYSDNDSCDVLCKMGIMPARDFYATGYPETLLDWFKDLKERSDDLKNDFINEIWNAIIGIDPIYTSTGT